MANKVLVISGTASPKDKSFSIALQNKFVEEYKKLNSDDEFIYLDLNDEKMAQITLSRDNMKDFFNQEDALNYIEQLKSVNKVIIASPMNNFAVSAMIKNYLDHILLANQTFSYKYSKKGDAKGLLDHLSVQVLTTQGAPIGWYPFGDHTNYLKGTWEFVGAKVNHPICFAGTKLEPVVSMDPNQAILQVESEIIKAAKSF
ncbi:FMN-dependent NADH-azoreductase [Spiroplasma tabanidicola]|uniref:FMN dependent NADH:quinone oxidoreductase n=1 Tax=Spiroplasma tabanidicola TaxID=324079 RepID=A0A6I6CD02_9MOLU|nr:FMN-dependent NADH-azoreductase [Spiroplasma tabanidicola]QGS52012.1 FMN-dependent NADH-azoreductase [Spiroplasma tabanidicola]